MGWGGKVTLLGCKIGVMNRLPASFFVSVAYDCWAFRRLGRGPRRENRRDPGRWLYRGRRTRSRLLAVGQGFKLTGSEVVIERTVTEEKIRSIRTGDVVVINGLVHTGRDMIHHYLAHHDAPIDLKGHIIYHCGPVMLKHRRRLESHCGGADHVISRRAVPGRHLKKFGVRAVIGKGGMGAKTLRGLQEHGAVYLNAIGGAAQFYADCITGVEGVDLLEKFGVPRRCGTCGSTASPRSDDGLPRPQPA